jgi:hypothetical protein
MSNEKWYGWLCIEDVTITVDEEIFTYKVGDQAPAHIVANFPRNARERYFERNYHRRGDVKIQD